MEKVNLPLIDAIIGLPHNKKRRRFWFKILSNDLKKGGEWINGLELSKTRRDREIIALAQEAAWSYLRHFGRKKRVRIPARNIHILKEGGIKAMSDGKTIGGMHSDTTGCIKVDRYENDTIFAMTLFHEFYHLGAYKVFRIFHGKNWERLKGWRQGVVSWRGHKKRRYLAWAEEAVIEHMTRRFYREYLRDHPGFPKLRKVALERQNELKELQHLARIARTTNKRRMWKIKNANKVIHLFCQAQSTGNWLPIARVVRQVFGKPSFFREMAEYDGY